MYTIRYDLAEKLIEEPWPTAINCSVLDAQYFLSQDPIVIEYEDFI
jgi:hypothetical protein